MNPTQLLQKTKFSAFDRRNYAEGSATPRSAEVMQALFAFAASQPDRSFLLPFFHWSTIEELDSAFTEALDYHLNDLEKCIAQEESEIFFEQYELDRNRAHADRLTEILRSSKSLSALSPDHVSTKIKNLQGSIND